MRIAVLGPGGVGGLLAAVLERGSAEVVVVARRSTAGLIAQRGLSVSSVRFGEMLVRPRVVEALSEPVDALLVATKAEGLSAGLERIEAAPGIVLPLLNGLDHIELLRSRFRPADVPAGSIRVEADRPEPGVVVHTSPFLLVSMATAHPDAVAAMDALAAALSEVEIPVKVQMPVSRASEANVLWSKLVRLNALACTTSAYDVLLGRIRDTPQLRADLVGAIEEAAAVARAEGADAVDAERAVQELQDAHPTLGSSMQRDIAAGRAPELDEIPGSVLRAAARHGIPCPTVERLVRAISSRAGVPLPAVLGPAGP
jgi:2-dehydropantoate 2-reductase